MSVLAVGREPALSLALAKPAEEADEAAKLVDRQTKMKSSSLRCCFPDSKQNHGTGELMLRHRPRHRLTLAPGIGLGPGLGLGRARGRVQEREQRPSTVDVGRMLAVISICRVGMARPQDRVSTE